MHTGGAHHLEGLVVLEGVTEADLVLGKDSEEVLVSLLKVSAISKSYFMKISIISGLFPLIRYMYKFKNIADKKQLLLWSQQNLEKLRAIRRVPLHLLTARSCTLSFWTSDLTRPTSIHICLRASLTAIL